MFKQLMQVLKKPDTGNQTMTKDAIAEFLRIHPEALEAFETSYEKNALNEVSDNFFDINSRQAAADRNTIAPDCPDIHVDKEYLAHLEDRIVEELLAQTEVFTFDGKLTKTEKLLKLPEGTKPVSLKDINQLPLDVRPQLSGTLMKKDFTEQNYPHLLWLYKESLEAESMEKRKYVYHTFRQGLDILDLDYITYEIIGTNKNSMGHWFPQLVEACQNQDYFKIPATTIAKVPITLLQLTRQEYGSLTQTTLNIVDNWAQKAFHLDENKEYFIKTGTYSSKFDFRNAHVHGAKEVRELGEYLLYIHFQALQMASPLSKPTIYGVSTTNEWVVREFIHDKENNPSIYKGLPLHTEYRVFVDCDTDNVIGITPYWEPETMKKRFGHGSDADSPHQLHDYVVYKAHEETLMNRYYENKDAVVSHIEAILPNLDLTGQWSIDVMQNGDDFWIIDMAVAENSAFYECVPKNLRKPVKENWIPELPVAAE